MFVYYSRNLNNKKMETHVVLDLVYLPEEGQECFSGTEQECYDFIQEQGEQGSATFMYKVVPIRHNEQE